MGARAAETPVRGAEQERAEKWEFCDTSCGEKESWRRGGGAFRMPACKSGESKSSKLEILKVRRVRP